MLPATISWLAALTVWPEPAGPTCTTVLPTASSTGRAASKSSASPPTMIDRLASIGAGLAAGDRGVEHAEAASRPACSASATRDVRADRGAVDAQRRRTWRWRRRRRRRAATASTSGESGTIVMTTSASRDGVGDACRRPGRRRSTSVSTLLRRGCSR